MAKVITSRRWKVVRTRFNELERVLNAGAEQQLVPWKLIVLSPEATKSTKFELVVIFRRLEESARPQATSVRAEEKGVGGVDLRDVRAVKRGHEEVSCDIKGVHNCAPVRRSVEREL